MSKFRKSAKLKEYFSNGQGRMLQYHKWVGDKTFKVSERPVDFNVK